MSANPRPRRSSGPLAVVVGVCVLVLIGCIGFKEAEGEHDTFSWWAEIFIPALVGAGTVLVSYAAFVASRRATDVAAQFERQRELNEEQRAADERKRRLQDMALEEARALNRLVVETYGADRFMPHSRPELKQAEVDARVALEQSIVPGAEELYKITLYDLAKRDDYVRVSRDESVMRKARKSQIASRRWERTKRRIRAWALDPEAEAKRLSAESRDIEDAPVDYLMFGEDPELIA